MQLSTVLLSTIAVAVAAAAPTTTDPTSAVDLSKFTPSTVINFINHIKTDANCENIKSADDVIAYLKSLPKAVENADKQSTGSANENKVHARYTWQDGMNLFGCILGAVAGTPKFC